MKIVIPEHLKGKELFKFLIENKSALIAQKKSIIKWDDSVSSHPALFQVNVKDGQVVKAAITDVAPDVTSVRVKVVANTSLWCDSHMDVLLRDSAKKSIKERKGLIPHLHDHEYNVVDAEVGEVQDIYYEDIPLKDLGVNKIGTAQALVFETDIIKSYNEKVFNKYKAGKIRQHSIGLQYIKLELAINDEESEKEFDFWNKYVDQVINRETVEDKGYFWVVPEYRLLENSAVLFGSNSLTPTLEVKSDTEDQPPTEGTESQPSGTVAKEAGVEIDKLANLNFFN